MADEAADDTFYAVANYTAFPPLVKELDGLKGATADAVAGRAVARADGSALPVGIAPVELSRPLRIVYLYPDALNLYGDGGNVIASSVAAPGAASPFAWTRSVWASHSISPMPISS